MPKKRKQIVRELRPVLHIFCEGAKTEPHYFDQYIRRFAKSPSRICIERTKKNTPVQLVQEAKKMCGRSNVLKEDVFWVVFDRESEQKYPEALHDQARQLAQANGIHIALSNVCFEAWLLLHRRETCPACNCCEELTSRKEFREAFPKYAKGVEILFAKSEIDKARVRAYAMNLRTKSGADPSWTVPSKWNPYTDVGCVLDAIDELP